MLGELFRSKCFRLLLIMVVQLATFPYTDHLPVGRIALRVVMSLVMLGLIEAAGTSRSRALTMLVLGLPALLHPWRVGDPGGVAETVGLIFWLLLYMYAIVVLIQYVFGASGSVTLDRMCGSLCVYLLIGLVFSGLHLLVFQHTEGAFAMPGETAFEGHSEAASRHFLFYSFVTLTTLGYGDTAPLNDAAKSLAILEAMTGTLYVAVLVARLVSLYRSPIQEKSAE